MNVSDRGERVSPRARAPGQAFCVGGYEALKRHLPLSTLWDNTDFPTVFCPGLVQLQLHFVSLEFADVKTSQLKTLLFKSVFYSDAVFTVTVVKR